MALPTFLFTADGTAGLQLGANYLAGSGQCTLTGTPPFTASAQQPIVISIIQAATYGQGALEVSTIYYVTNVSGTVLTLGGVVFGIDQNYPAGSIVQSRGCAAVWGAAQTLFLSILSASHGAIPYVNALGGVNFLPSGTAGQVLTTSGSSADPYWSNASGGGGGSGTVTGVSLATADGFTGTVANPTTAPVLTLGTTVAGIVKGTAGQLASAVPGVDYLASATPPTTQQNGTSVSTRNTLNFIQGANVVLSIADDSLNIRTDITISASGASAANPIGVEQGGVLESTRNTVNFIQGPNIVLSVADNPSNSRADITISASGASASSVAVQQGGTLESTRGIINFIQGANTVVTVVDNPGASRADITITASGSGIFLSVANTTVRNAIPNANRIAGMIVYTPQNGGIYWEWNGGTTGTDADWIQGSPLQVEQNGSAVSSRGTINFIPGTSNVAISVADNPTNDRADITISVTGSSGTGAIGVQQGGTLESTRSIINMISGSNTTVTVVDNPGASRADITINSTAGPAELPAVLGAYNVLAYGADPTGVADATSAIQSALTAAATTGAQVVVPAGQYLIAGQLSVPAGVSLVGTFVGAPDYAGAPTTGGSQLWITGNAGNANATPAISLTNCTALIGFTLYWPNQSSTATTPTAYPWAISMNTPTQGAVTVRDCCLVNPYQGILVTGAVRASVYRVYGQPLLTGLSVVSVGDICRLHEVHFVWVWATQGSNPQIWAQANGTAFQFGRSDEQVCSDLFALGYNVGYSFYDQTTGALNGTTYGTFTGCSADACNTGILAASVGGEGAGGVVQGVSWIGGGLEASGTQISLAAGAMIFVGVRFFYTGTTSIAHTGGDLAIHDCRFASEIAITSSGNALNFTDNTLTNLSSTVALSGAVQAVLYPNLLEGGSFPSIVSNTSSGGVILSPVPVVPSNLLFGLHAYLRCDETTGTSILDSTGSGLNWTNSDTTVSGAGPISGHAAIQFDGTNYLSLVDPTLLTGATWTIGGWTYVTSNATEYVLFAKQASATPQFLDIFWQYTIPPTFRFTDNVNSATSASVTINTWYFICVAFDGTNCHCYLGGLTGSLTTVGSYAHAQPTSTYYSNPAYLGYTSEQPPSGSRVSGWGFYSRCLSAAEVAQWWNGGAGLNLI